MKNQLYMAAGWPFEDRCRMAEEALHNLMREFEKILIDTTTLGGKIYKEAKEKIDETPIDVMKKAVFYEEISTNNNAYLQGISTLLKGKWQEGLTMYGTIYGNDAVKFAAEKMRKSVN